MNPNGLCKCGCGQLTPIAKNTNKKLGLIKGQPINYVHGHALRGKHKTDEQKRRLSIARKGKPLSEKHRLAVLQNVKRGPDNYAYKGGIWIENRSGRCYIRCRNGRGQLYYRAVMECYLKRQLTKDEVVHHINGDPTDDRLENLLLTTASHHNSISNTKYTKEVMTKKIIDFVNQFGRVPTIKSWANAKYTPNIKTYKKYFGSWSNALKEASQVG